MKRLTFPMLVALLLLVSAPARALPYELQYNPANGNLTIDSLDPANKLRSYILRSTNNSMIPGNRNTVLPGEVVQTDFTSQIYITSPLAVTPAQALLADPSLASVIDGTRWGLGNIMPTGLTLAQLNADLAFPFDSQYSPGPGTSPNTAFSLVVVPEPASLSLVALGGAMLMRRRGIN